MDKTYCEKIADLIRNVARREDAELVKISNKGIMRCPELAFVYSVAKELSIRSHQMFPMLNNRQDKLQWSMEESKKVNIKRLDLYIDPKLPAPKEGIIAIEFKLGYEVGKWIKDVKKLEKIDGNVLCRIFCAIITEKQGVGIGKIKRLEEFEDRCKEESLYVRLIDNYDSFCTLGDDGITEKQCIVGIWEVKQGKM